MIDNLTRVLDDVARERIKQDRKWGVQDRVAGHWLTILMEEVGEVCEEILNKQNSDSGIREELVQVAAVAIAWIENIDRENR